MLIFPFGYIIFRVWKFNRSKIYHRRLGLAGKVLGLLRLSALHFVGSESVFFLKEMLKEEFLIICTFQRLAHSSCCRSLVVNVQVLFRFCQRVKKIKRKTFMIFLL